MIGLSKVMTSDWIQDFELLASKQSVSVKSFVSIEASFLVPK